MRWVALLLMSFIMACTSEGSQTSNGINFGPNDPWTNIYAPPEAELLTSGEQQVPPNINLWARFYELPTEQRYYVEIMQVFHEDGIERAPFDHVIDDAGRTDNLQGVLCTTQGKTRSIETGQELVAIKVGMCVLGRLPSKSWDYDEALIQQIFDSY